MYVAKGLSLTTAQFVSFPLFLPFKPAYFKVHFQAHYPILHYYIWTSLRHMSMTTKCVHSMYSTTQA